MIIKLNQAEIKEAVLAWVAAQMDSAIQTQGFNTVDFHYSNGCEVFWVEPDENEIENV